MTELTILNEAAQFLEENILQQWEAQGHKLTGAWERSLTHNAVGENEVEGLAQGYGMIVDAGVSPDRIPYGGTGTGNGSGTSLYIQGLVNFWIARGKDPKTALSLAFATAKVQK